MAISREDTSALARISSGSFNILLNMAGISFGYVMNQMQLAVNDDARNLALIAAVHESLKG